VHIRKIPQLPEVNQRWQAALGRQLNEDDIEGMFQDFIPLQLACLAD
jgi:phosphonoacetaldehyde hydrolase